MVSSYQSIVSFLFLHFLGTCSATKFTLVNQCTYTVWPATLSGAGTPPLPPSASSFTLLPRASTVIPVPASWSGRIWAQTGCSTGPAGNFSCETGTTPPATLAEFTLNGANGLDFYDVSLVDGYNLPLVVRPVGGSGNCSAAGCPEDLNGACPTPLRVATSAFKTGTEGGGRGIACNSACNAFGNPEYCCSGAYATPDTCKPSNYSEYFKVNCPSAYSYAYDDASSTFTCAGADYVVTFCPSVSLTAKAIGTQPPQTSTSPSSYGDFNYNGGSALITSSTMIGMLITVVWTSLSLI
ncbi:pathogenesis-related thaumatin-like protein 3.5 [Silene latifolia]|uniref:pathogenesis-related thaumatin-like protein 3.5 n=1 Tax=Silene latifolia TaxID=37657 RepID=UPI003D7765D6